MSFVGIDAAQKPTLRAALLNLQRQISELPKGLRAVDADVEIAAARTTTASLFERLVPILDADGSSPLDSAEEADIRTMFAAATDAIDVAYRRAQPFTTEQEDRIRQLIGEMIR